MTDEERQRLVARFRAHEVVMWTDIDLAANEIERLAAIIKDYKLTFGDIHDVKWGRRDAQSDAKPAQSQTLRDAAENLLIAIGMGWDIEGCVENLRAALAQSNAADVSGIKFWQEEAAKWAKMFAEERRNHEFEERRWPRPPLGMNR